MTSVLGTPNQRKLRDRRVREHDVVLAGKLYGEIEDPVMPRRPDRLK